jgi:hypothetical protein
VFNDRAFQASSPKLPTPGGNVGGFFVFVEIGVDTSSDTSYSPSYRNTKGFHMTQDQKDFIQALRTVSNDVADWAEERIFNGDTFDEMQTKLRNAVKLVDGWRIGRGV